MPAPQQSTLAARGPAKARAAALAMNNPIAARAVEAWTAALVGKGWQVQSQHPDRQLARVLNDDLEALVWPLLPLIARAIVRDGEAFLRILSGPDGFRLSLLPADQIDPAKNVDLGNGARIIAGVEFDAEDRVIAYHVLRDAPGSTFVTFADSVRVPAGEMLHIFDQHHAGQVPPRRQHGTASHSRGRSNASGLSAITAAPGAVVPLLPPQRQGNVA